MPERTYRVGEVAELAKLTVRTLHHYDQIGLLEPSARSAAGYRQYTRSDLERLQQIRLYRELGFSLEQVRSLLDSATFDNRGALVEHRRRLVARIEKTSSLVATIDRMLTAQEGGKTVTNQDLFDGFQPEQHHAEAEERWGDTAAWRESRRRTNSYGPAQWRQIKDETEAIFRDMAAVQASGAEPDSPEAIGIAKRHRQHIDRWFYACGAEMHTALASMYVSDPRFAVTFERHGNGLAAYFERAIRANVETGEESQPV